MRRYFMFYFVGSFSPLGSLICQNIIVCCLWKNIICVFSGQKLSLMLLLQLSRLQCIISFLPDLIMPLPAVMMIKLTTFTSSIQLHNGSVEVIHYIVCSTAEVSNQIERWTLHAIFLAVSPTLFFNFYFSVAWETIDCLSNLPLPFFAAVIVLPAIKYY